MSRAQDRSDEVRGPWRTFGSAMLTGAVLLAGFCVLEWLVLFARLPVDWSAGVVALALRNTLLYALVGVAAGVVLGAVVVLLRVSSVTRTLSRPATAWALGLAGAVTFYWVHAANVLYPGGAREPAALALDAVAVLAGLLLALLLVRSLTRSGRPGRIVVVTCIVLISLWMPFYVMVSDRAGERVTGGPDLGPVNVERAGAESLPNVILVMLDTTRTDCLGCYGSTDGLTPNIDRLASESVLFEQAVTPEPLTRPAASTILTGMYPRSHGVDTNTKSLDAAFVTLAETLREKGYVTGAFMAATVLSGYYGTDQGFDSYTEPVEGTWELSPLLALTRLRASLFDPGSRSVEILADEVTRRATSWIRANSDRRFFAFVHYFDPHYPYDPPPAHDLATRAGLGDVPVPYADPQERFREGFEMPPDFLEMMWLDYQGEIAFMDEEVGRLLASLDELGVSEETLVILLSDHGESFEKGFYFAHGNRLYDTLVHVALMLRYPGFLRPGRVVSQVSLLDVYPTLCDLLGVEGEPGSQGRSFLPAALDRRALDPVPVFMQTDFENPKPFSSRVSMGVRLPPWKYVESPELDLVELYDLDSDPGEKRNLSRFEPDTAREMSSRIQQWLAATDHRVTEDAQLSPERLEELRALGYVQ